MGTPWGPSNAFTPTIDGNWMTDPPLQMFNSLQWKQCPIMIGWNSVEQNLLGVLDIGSFPIIPLSDSHFTQLVYEIFGAQNDTNSFSPFVLSNYAAERQTLGNWQALAHAFADWALLHRCPALADKGFTNSESPVYIYLFQHVPQYWIFTTLGATHTAELSFVFDNTDEQNMIFAADEIPFAQDVMNIWINFATTNVPQKGWPDYRSSGLVQPLDLTFPSPIPYNISTTCMNWGPLLVSGQFPTATLYN